MTTTRTYTVSLKDGDVKITNSQLERFQSFYSLPEDIMQRVSELLWLDLYVYDAHFGVNPDVVLSEIKSLELLPSSQSQTKPATEFSRSPLKGLWHKHYFSAHFVPQNIVNGLAGGKLEKLVAKVMDASNNPIVTQDIINELSHRVVHDPLDNRASANKLTGEWIVFAKVDTKNFYLCLNTHDAGDQHVADRIEMHCLREFPFLARTLSAARA